MLPFNYSGLLGEQVIQQDKLAATQKQIDALNKSADDAQKAAEAAASSRKEISAASDQYSKAMRDAAAALMTDTQAADLIQEAGYVEQIKRMIAILQKHGADVHGYVDQLAATMANNHTTVTQKIAQLAYESKKPQ